MPLSAWLVQAYRSLTGIEPLVDLEDWRANVEIFAVFWMMLIFGVGFGIALIQFPQGRTFSLLFALYGGGLGFFLGTALPLQLVAWKRLSEARLRASKARILIPLLVSLAGMVIAIGLG